MAYWPQHFCSLAGPLAKSRTSCSPSRMINPTRMPRRMVVAVSKRLASTGWKEVLFHTAIPGSPGCSPPGIAYWQVSPMIEHAGTHASKFDNKYATFPDLLEKAGYWIGYTGKGWGPVIIGMHRFRTAGRCFRRRKKLRYQGVFTDRLRREFRRIPRAAADGKPFTLARGHDASCF